MKLLKTIFALSLLLSFAGVAVGATFDFAKPVALFETTLANRITTTDTSMTLTSATTKDGSTLASSTYGFIIDEGTANEEFVLADCTATACTNLTRGVSTLNGTSSVVALKKEHRRGASVKITDAPILLQVYNILTGVQSLISNLSVGGNVNVTGTLGVTGATTLTNFTATNGTTTNATSTAMYVSSLLQAISATITSLTTDNLTVNTSASLPATTFSATSTLSQGGLLGYSIDGSSDNLAIANKSYVDGVSVAGASNANETTKGIVELATKAEASLGTSLGGTSARLALPASMATSTSQVATTSVVVTNTSGKIDPTFVSSTAYSLASTTLTSTTSISNLVDQNFIRINKFGGTGADGALTLTSGTTTIDLGGEAIVTKNYTSISITGTGALAFSNSHANGTIVILKSQGDVTITCSNAPCISVVSNGGTGGAGRNGTTGNGAGGTSGIALSLFNNPSAGGGGTQTSGSSDVSGTAGSAIAIATTFSKIFSATNFLTLQKYQHAFTGSGGGGGAVYVNSSTGTGGTGGNGAGALIIECGGAWNFTKTGGIWASGTNGASGVNGGATSYIVAGGGGGAGGFVQVLYNKLTANTGTIITTGGSGGGCVNAGDPIVSVGRGGGGGSYGAGNAGGYHYVNCGESGSNGNGSAGISIVAQNLEF